jgi:Cdc6-like AAA superfamily ATPase
MQPNLPGREAEFINVLNFVQAALGSRSGKLFVVGIPGTGKTAVVKAALEAYAHGQHRTLEFNGMSYEHPRKFLKDLCYRLTNTKHRAYTQVAAAITEWSRTAPHPCLLFVDEIDRLVLPRTTKSRTVKMDDILYRLLEWSERNLILIGTSNTHDLAERMPARLQSRTTGSFALFKAYTSPQLISILRHRYPTKLDQKLLEHVAKKVAVNSGDIRMAFKLADQLVRTEGIANFNDLDIIEALESPIEKALRTLPHYQKQILIALVRHKRFSSEPPTAGMLISSISVPPHLRGQMNFSRCIDDLLSIGFLKVITHYPAIPLCTVDFFNVSLEDVEHFCPT